MLAIIKLDTVGIMDSYFPNYSFYTEFKIFDNFIKKIRNTNQKLNYIIAFMSNYLHDAYIYFSSHVYVVYEKHLTLNSWNIDTLECMKKQTGFRVNNII